MSLARVEIEQHSATAWHAEVEVGGLIARRRVVNATNWDDLILAVNDAYREIIPSPPTRAPAVIEPAPSLPESDDGVPANYHAALVAEAEAVGVQVDGRWGERRLREEIDMARGRVGSTNADVGRVEV